MYSLVKYSEEHRAAWNEFVKANNGTVFHLIEWKEVLEEAFGYKHIYYLVMDENQRLCGVIPMVTGRDILMRKIGMSLPFVNYMDICCRDQSVFDFIIQEVGRLSSNSGLKHIELRLKDQVIESRAGIALNDHNYALVIPMEGDEEQILAKCKSSNRTHIRKPYKENWFTTIFSKDHLPEFYDIRRATLKRLGTPVEDYKFFELMMDKLSEYIEVLSVADRENGRIVGSMFLFIFGDTIYYQWGGAYTEYNKKYVNNYMYWEAVKYGLKNGYKYLDLGRSPYEKGTYNFKIQFGAMPVQLRYYKFGNNIEGTEINADNMSAFISLWKVLPNFITDFAGKILIKYVMP